MDALAAAALSYDYDEGPKLVNYSNSYSSLQWNDLEYISSSNKWMFIHLDMLPFQFYKNISRRRSVATLLHCLLSFEYFFSSCPFPNDYYICCCLNFFLQSYVQDVKSLMWLGVLEIVHWLKMWLNCSVYIYIYLTLPNWFYNIKLGLKSIF